MKQVKIINGIYGHRPKDAKVITPVRAGEVVEVSDEKAACLSALGIAIDIGVGLQESPAVPVATPEMGMKCVDASEDPPGDRNGAEVAEDGGRPQGDKPMDIVDGHYTAESLAHMTNASLANLGRAVGVDISKCKTKADYVAVLVEVEMAAQPDECDDGEVPPVTSMEDPVT